MLNTNFNSSIDEAFEIIKKNGGFTDIGTCYKKIKTCDY